MQTDVLLAAMMLFAGVVAGATAAWLFFRTENAILKTQAESSATRVTELETQISEARLRAEQAVKETARLGAAEAEARATLESERKSAAEKLALVEDAKQKLLDAFKALSADALKSNNEAFLTLAKGAFEGLVQPVQESLKSVGETQGKLKAETEKLVSALWAPTGWGAWGELKLTRAVELAGLQERVDFEVQSSSSGENGSVRPDMQVKLPTGRCILIDAKFPHAAFDEAAAAQEPAARAQKLKEHAEAVRGHVKKLADKRYWDKVEGALNFVVMFLPHEGLLAAAVEQKADLIDEAASQRVLIVTPATLMAMLLSVAYGWKQYALAENAHEISELGKEIYDRLRKLAEHFDNMRKALTGTVKAYNDAVGSLESRVLPSARRFKELGAAGDAEIVSVTPVETAPRQVQAPELTSADYSLAAPGETAEAKSAAAAAGN